MHCERAITRDLFWVGGNDRRLALFESVYPIPQGVSYNAYLLLDEKAVLLDTVDHAVSRVFFENLAHLLGDRPLDAVIVNHMEPDHAATLQQLVEKYPDVTIICNAKTAAMIRQFFTFETEGRLLTVKEGDTFGAGRHVLNFAMAPMVHWPEVMVTYDATDKILFSADAFGTFGALGGNMFADEAPFDMAEARRYYTNIVGKYGTQVQALLKKAAGLAIEMICPLHGPVWRKNIGLFVEKYQRWSTYTPEDQGVAIIYTSVYGNTENAAEILAGKLAGRGVSDVRLYDASVTHASYLVAEAFRCSHLVLATTTYNAGIFVNMENLLHDLCAHNLQNRTVALIENGSWAPTAGGLMKDLLAGLKNMTLLEPAVTLKSALKEDQLAGLDALADQLADSLPRPAVVHDGSPVEQNALFKLSYGLFVLSAKAGDKDNGCIINTVTQVTDSPKRISIAVNKQNLTHDMVKQTGVFNVSVLSADVPFRVFQDYGFRSGRNCDKLADQPDVARSANGVVYLTRYANAFLSAKVIQTVEYETHTVFFAEITEAKVLSGEASVTYADYFDHIKPKPAVTAEKKKGFVCKICGYVYEGDALPPDFICPLCKHGAEDFEPLA